jgi:hypothetical protein
VTTNKTIAQFPENCYLLLDISTSIADCCRRGQQAMTATEKPETLADLSSEAHHLAAALSDLRDRLRAKGEEGVESRSDIASGHLNAAWLLCDVAAQAIDLLLPPEPAIDPKTGRLIPW